MIILSMDLPWWMILSYAFVIGAVIGSFLNVCVYRIPQHRGLFDQLRALSNRPSHCPRCQTNIRWSDNIPIVGWLRLGGRCRKCRMRISRRYPTIELLNGLLVMLLLWAEIPLGIRDPLSDSSIYTAIGPQTFPGLGSLSPELFVWLRFAFHLVLVEALFVASLIDIDLRIIPESTTTPAHVFAVVALCVFPWLHIVPVWFQQGSLLQTFGIVTPEFIHPFLDGPGDASLGGLYVPGWISEHPYLHGLAVTLAGSVVGGGIVWLIRQAGFLLLREEAMGDGDVYLMAMVGAFLGWQPTLIAFFIAPICALLMVAITFPFSRNRSIPYGPYLSLGTLLTLVFWQDLWAAFARFYSLGVLLIPVGLVMACLFAVSLGTIYGIKRSLGLLPPEPPLGDWRAADQHLFFAGETVDRHTCRWKTADWEGTAASRGTVHEERWRGRPVFGPHSPWQR